MPTRRSPENDLQRNVIELAEMLGYRCYHNARAKGNLRAKTSVGFQDLVMVRAPRLMFAEMKAPGKYLTPGAEALEDGDRGVRQARGLWTLAPRRLGRDCRNTSTEDGMTLHRTSIGDVAADVVKDIADRLRRKTEATCGTITAGVIGCGRDLLQSVPRLWLDKLSARERVL